MRLWCRGAEFFRPGKIALNVAIERSIPPVQLSDGPLRLARESAGSTKSANIQIATTSTNTPAPLLVFGGVLQVPEVEAGAEVAAAVGVAAAVASAEALPVEAVPDRAGDNKIPLAESERHSG